MISYASLHDFIVLNHVRRNFCSESFNYRHRQSFGVGVPLATVAHRRYFVCQVICAIVSSVVCNALRAMTNRLPVIQTSARPAAVDAEQSTVAN